MGNIRTVKSIKGFHQHKSLDLMLKLSFNSKFMMKYIIPMSFDKRKKKRKNTEPKDLCYFLTETKKKSNSVLECCVLLSRLCARHISFLAHHTVVCIVLYLHKYTFA